MGDHSPQELYNLRKWYGKWALRYSLAHLCLVVVPFLIPVNAEFYLIIFIIINALTSHLHLWPARRATLVTNGETWRVSALFFFILFIYSLPIVLIAFPNSLDGKERGTLVSILFFAPLLLMFEAYMNLAKGENQ